MSSFPIRKSMATTQLHKNKTERPLQPEQLASKKMPHSQKLSDPDFHLDSASLEDVSFLRLPEVKAFTRLSKTSIYELIREKSFPAPVRLGPRAVAWVRSEVRQWALERVRASRSVA